MRLLLVDNYDSFTYTLRHLLQTCHPAVAAVDVVRNDERTVAAVLAAGYDGIVISPGPDDPASSGISLGLLRSAVRGVDVPPVFGVCLGHQALGEACGGKVVRAAEVVHGTASLLEHDGGWLFEGVAQPFAAMRYHSLIVAPEAVPECLAVTAWLTSEQGAAPTSRIPMAFVHRGLPLASIQFHPESVGTTVGPQIATNVVTWMLHANGQSLENRCESSSKTDTATAIG